MKYEEKSLGGTSVETLQRGFDLRGKGALLLHPRFPLPCFMNCIFKCQSSKTEMCINPYKTKGKELFSISFTSA